MNFTPLARPYFSHIVARRSRWTTPGGAAQVQRRLMASLLKQGAKTRYGACYGFAHFRSYDDFGSHVPVIEYEDIRHEAGRMVAGEKDIL